MLQTLPRNNLTPKLYDSGGGGYRACQLFEYNQLEELKHEELIHRQWAIRTKIPNCAIKLNLSLIQPTFKEKVFALNFF